MKSISETLKVHAHMRKLGYVWSDRAWPDANGNGGCYIPAMRDDAGNVRTLKAPGATDITNRNGIRAAYRRGVRALVAAHKVPPGTRAVEYLGPERVTVEPGQGDAAGETKRMMGLGFSFDPVAGRWVR